MLKNFALFTKTIYKNYLNVMKRTFVLNYINTYNKLDISTKKKPTTIFVHRIFCVKKYFSPVICYYIRQVIQT